MSERFLFVLGEEGRVLSLDLIKLVQEQQLLIKHHFEQIKADLPVLVQPPPLLLDHQHALVNLYNASQHLRSEVIVVQEVLHYSSGSVVEVVHYILYRRNKSMPQLILQSELQS